MSEQIYLCRNPIPCTTQCDECILAEEKRTNDMAKELYELCKEDAQIEATYTQSELDEALRKQREEIKSELIASVNVIFRPHIEGVFGVIENKLNATIEDE